MQISIIQGKPESRKLKVCAYCRVSTDDEEQENSLENQMTHYEKVIKANPDYEYVGVYSDFAISGFKEKRPGLQQMLADARDGKIEIFLRTLIQCPAHRSVENSLKQRLSADLNILPKAFFFMSWNDWMVTRTV